MLRTILFCDVVSLNAESLLHERTHSDLFRHGMMCDFPDHLTSSTFLRITITFDSSNSVLIIILEDLYLYSGSLFKHEDRERRTHFAVVSSMVSVGGPASFVVKASRRNIQTTLGRTSEMPSQAVSRVSCKDITLLTACSIKTSFPINPNLGSTVSVICPSSQLALLESGVLKVSFITMLCGAFRPLSP